MDKQSVVVVTGAGSGIGQATAIAFSKQGHFVVGLDLSEAGLQKTKSLIAADLFHAVDLDVRDEVQVAEAFKYVRSTGLNLHAVAACAGVAKTSAVHEQSEEDWDFIVDINLKGVWLTAKSAMTIFLKQGKGSFIAVGSDASVRGASGYAAYCASKHGVLGLVRCLALDYGPLGIRSNAVCPGFVLTPMMDALLSDSSDPEAEMKSYAKEVPLGRFAQPDEVAKAILHLSSDDASYTNGAIYSLDGGATAGHFSSLV
ncbi:SDR family NAD(P)-dependent oxidoreductase [Pseudomonas brassicacearum]|uniref:SDR family NAD(P)-dependent oxidoreductase n=1 Tax=Pseudomonas brassicacearum TaxID=930166 RepID=UPI003ECE32EB